MSKRDAKLYLTDIDDAIAAIHTYLEGFSYEQLVTDRKTREAVILNLVIIGEAVKKIPPDIIDQYPDVPWKEFAGMRDKMVHGYFQISPMIVWETARNDLGTLSSAVKKLLQTYG